MRAKIINGQFVVTLTAKEAAKYGVVSGNVVPSAPAERTFATKAEREAGNGFECPKCARKDLRTKPRPATATKPASYHFKDDKDNSEICTPFAD